VTQSMRAFQNSELRALLDQDSKVCGYESYDCVFVWFTGADSSCYSSIHEWCLTVVCALQKRGKKLALHRIAALNKHRNTVMQQSVSGQSGSASVGQ